MAKDKKSKAAEKKARVAQKTEKKAAQKEKKSSKKTGKDKDNDDGADADDADMDAILAEFAREQEQYLKVTEVESDPPPPRSASTIAASPNDGREIFLFGGEHFNGALASFSNDLYIYRISNDTWRKVTSPNSPLPRSGHAMCRGDNAGGIYLFGGEFSSPKQGTFYHYNDFWRLDPGTREWTRLETKGSSPSARSGHRMVGFKRYIVLFGGFQDTSASTKYLGDLWIYDCQTFAWHSPVLPPAAGKPDARSSFSFLPHEGGAVLYGGYSRVKSSLVTNKGKGGRQMSRVVMKPVVHADTWFLRITPPGPDAAANALPTVRWERRKRPGNSPNPPRAGATMCFHKGRGVMFGGVHDVEEDEEGIESEFFNQTWVYNVERNRFFQLSLRKPRAAPKRPAAGGERGKRGRGKADEEELLRNLALLENKGTLDGDSAGDIGRPQNGDAHSDSDDEDKVVEKPVLTEYPHPRFNAQLAVQGDVLFIYGGTFEKGDQEFTFDEMYAVDLGKLDGVREIFRREPEDWQGSEDEEDSEDESEEEDDDDEMLEDEETQKDQPQLFSPSKRKPKTDTESDVGPQTELPPKEEEEEEENRASDDKLPHPRPFESLRDFFARTSQLWQEMLLTSISSGGSGADKSIKEVRKAAFEKAEGQWWDCREEVLALEAEQEEAGIGEVVSLEARAAQDGGGAGARRR